MAAVAQSQSGQEPPSGIQGSGTVNEPYDQGNAPGIATFFSRLLDCRLTTMAAR